MASVSCVQAFRGHTDAVSSIDVWGRLLVSGSKDKSIRLWDNQLGKCRASLREHTEAISCLKMAKKQLFSGSEDNTLRKWDLETGHCVAVYGLPLYGYGSLWGHQRAITSLDIVLAEHQDILYSGSRDYTARSWDARSGTCVRVFEGHKGTVWDVKVIGKELFTVSDDCTIRVWDVGMGKVRTTMHGHRSRIRCLYYDGEELFTGSTMSKDLVRSWDITLGESKRVYYSSFKTITAMARQESFLLAATTESAVATWDLNSSAPGKPISAVKCHSKAINDILTVEEDNLVYTASSDNTIRSWDSRTFLNPDAREQVALDMARLKNDDGYHAETGIEADGGVNVLTEIDFLESSEMQHVRDLAYKLDSIFPEGKPLMKGRERQNITALLDSTPREIRDLKDMKSLIRQVRRRPETAQPAPGKENGLMGGIRRASMHALAKDLGELEKKLGGALKTGLEESTDEDEWLEDEEIDLGLQRLGQRGKALKEKADELGVQLPHVAKEQKYEAMKQSLSMSDMSSDSEETMSTASSVDEEAKNADAVAPYNKLIEMYGESENLDKALRVYEEVVALGLRPMMKTFESILTCCKNSKNLPKAQMVCLEMKRNGRRPNIECYNLLLETAIVSDHLDETMVILHEMKRLLVTPNLRTYNLLIQGFSEAGKVADAGFVMTMMKKAQISPTLVTYTHILKACANTGSMDLAMKTFVELKGHNLHPNLEIFNIIIQGYGKTMQLEKAFGMLDTIKLHGVRPNDEIYATLIRLCEYCNDPERALQTFQEMEDLGFKAGTHVFTDLIKVCARCKLLDETHHLLELMKRRQTPPTKLIYTSIIKAYVTSERLERAFDMLYEMRSMRIWPTLDIYNTLLKGCSVAREKEKAFELIGIMKDPGPWKINVDPDEITYRMLVEVCVRCNDMDMALKVLGEMKQIGIEPDARVYNLLIKGYGKSNRLDKALKVFDMMIEFKVNPVQETFISIIHLAEKADQFSLAVETFTKMESQYNLPPNLDAYLALVRAYCKRVKNPEDLEEPFRLLQEIREKGIRRNEEIFALVINSCIKVNRLDKAIQIFREMRIQENLMPSAALSVTLIHQCVKDKDINTAFAYYDDLKERGIVPNIGVYAALMESCIECEPVKIDKAMEVFDQMKSAGVRPNVSVYNVLIKGHCMLGRLARAFDAVEEMRGQRIWPNQDTYLCLIKSCINVKEFDRGWSTLLRMNNLGCYGRVEVAIYNEFIKGYTEMKRYEKAYSVLKTLVRNNVKPDSVTYDYIISNLVESGEVGLMMEKYREMKAFNLKPSEATYCKIMVTLVDAKKEDVACGIQKAMLKDGYKGDIHSNYKVNAAMDQKRSERRERNRRNSPYTSVE